MTNVIKLKKGLDLKLEGAAACVYESIQPSKQIGFDPSDFYGMVPRPMLKVGDSVKVGTVLFEDKNRPALKVVSPVSGTLSAINRGDRRKILEFVIDNDGQGASESIAAFDGSSAESVKNSLSQAGMLAFFKQRPYDVVINPEDTPKAVFVSTFDNAPLAPDMAFILKESMAEFQAGVDALAKIAPVYLGIQAGVEQFASINNATVTAFEGNYPACNVGVQINHVLPINKGDIYWTITPQELVFIGRYVKTSKLDFVKTVALTGACASKPAYYKVLLGTPVSALCPALSADVRVIAGHALCGKQLSSQSWIAPLCSQLTLLPEGNNVHEMLGWVMPRFNMFSVNGSFVSGMFPFLFKNKTFKFDTRILGGERHMIMSGEYDRVFPMDIYAGYLIKAIIAGDIDRMEALGIYEVAPEDFAAAEFVCSSKMELQRIVRQGLDMLRKEMC